MPRAAGTYTLPPIYLGVTGQVILATQHNSPLEDIAAALTDSLPRDGSAGMQTALPMGGYQINNMADGVLPTDGATVGQASTAAATAITTAPLKATPIDADTIPLVDSAAGNIMKRLTWANLKSLFQPVNAVLTALGGIGTAVAGDLIYASAAGVWARLAKGTDGQILTLASGLPTWASASGGIAQSASVDTSTGATSYDVTGIPSWAKRVTILVRGCSFTGSTMTFRLGSSGGIVATGYTGAVSLVQNGAATSSLSTGIATAGTGVIHGIITIVRMSANLWVFTLNVCYSDVTYTLNSYGSVNVAATLDRIRLTTTGGSATGNAGSMVVCWE